MTEKSFHSVGLNEILKAAQVPKGSFYHYFESKEQFGVELLRHYVTGVNACKRHMLLSSSAEPNPLRRLTTHLEMGVGKLCETEGKCPCLITKLASEVADTCEEMRQILVDSQEEWTRILEELLEEGVRTGCMRRDIDPKALAPVIGDLCNGALQHATILRNVSPLRSAITFLQTLLSPP